MPRLPTILLILTLWAPAARADVLGAIDAEHERGLIDEATFHRYRVLAVRDPGRLPARLRALAGEETRRSGTAVLFAAFRWLLATGREGGSLHQLLAMPADLPYTMDSSEIPLRVSYEAGQEDYARRVMEAAEVSWQIQVSDYGFYEPLYEEDLGPYRIFIQDTGSGVAGYTAPYEKNPATPRSDCFTYIVISPSLGSHARSTVAHELNHGMQSAMDCAESMAYMENTANYIEAQVFPGDAAQALWMMYYFQSDPWMSLDFVEYGEGYQYGGSLFNYFLVDAYAAPGEGPLLVRRIWEAAMQDDFDNSVSYMDAVESVLVGEGAIQSFDSLFMDFSEARYFVGEQDDGAHIEGAGDWWFAPLSIVKRLTAAELLLVGVVPDDEARWPRAYGSNHVLIVLPQEYGFPIRVRFDGDDSARWAARVLAFGGSLPTTATDITLDASSWEGEATVETEGHSDLILVVTHLGGEGYRPTVGIRTPLSYSYDLLPQIPAPRVLAVEPSSLEAGQQDVPILIRGEGFVTGNAFDVAFSDPAIQVVSVQSVSSTEVLARITIPGLVAAGPKDVLVTNGGGEVGVGEGILLVTHPELGGGGCGCDTGGRGAPWGWLLLLSLVLLLARRMRCAAKQR